MSEELQIKNWLKEHEIKYSEGQINAMLYYIDRIRDYSENINLVSAKDLPNLVERHLLDSLLALTVYDVPREAKVADVGSGAGFPGIPIAIMRPDLHMYLIESRKKKSLFLSNVISKIGLANAMVINDRWENINLQFEVVFARAIFPENQVLGKLQDSLAPQGAVLYFSKYNQIKVLKPTT